MSDNQNPKASIDTSFETLKLPDLKFIMDKLWFTMDKAPTDGTPVFLWSEEFECADFNPSGIVDGFFDLLGYQTLVRACAVDA